jgi:hypothetical protein
VVVLLVAATGCMPWGPGGGPARAGTLDARSGSGGLVTTDVGTLGGGFNAEATALAVQPDGKIVVAGAIERFQVGSAIREMAIARYDRHGALDAPFGLGGLVIVGFGTEDLSEA